LTIKYSKAGEAGGLVGKGEALIALVQTSGPDGGVVPAENLFGQVKLHTQLAKDTADMHPVPLENRFRG
jgi:hypothetical protein